jgi:hypothetical protein
MTSKTNVLQLADFHGALEAEARAYTRQFIANVKEGDFIGLGCELTHPDAGHRLLRRLMSQWSAHSSATQMFILVEVALAGWEDAQIVCRDLILEYTNRGEPLPSFLAYYNAKILAGDIALHPPGQDKADNIMLDMVAVTLVMELVAMGLKEHRYQLGRKRRASACSIVAEEMAEAGLHRGGEEAVWKIWKRYRPAVVPGMVKAPPKLRAKFQ